MPLASRLQATLGTSFRVDRELGGGGMSRVFVAEEVALGRQVVIKLLPPDTAAAVSAERFRREIQLAARLQHPHIVPLITTGEMDGLPFYIMPFVEGESLRARLVRHGEMPLADALRTLREVASALAYAHERGVVHRDIKPENVLISHDSVMVTDFGVAKAISASADTPESAGLTSMGMAMGTPAYMAPEQAAADPATDHRADIYALGIMAYELISGTPPFAGRSAGQMLAAHLAETPEPLSVRRPGVPESLETLVMRCLEKRPADRPQNATEVVRALDGVLSTGSMTPATGARGVVRRRGTRKHVIMTIALGLLLLLGGAVWRGFFWSSAPSASERGVTMLAVLPFENQGPAEDAYFADGIAEAIANRLATLEGIGVIDRRSASEYAGSGRSVREIGRELGVDYVLLGTVRWATAGGERRVQISPSLVRVSDATTRWAAEPYVVTPTDVFEVQSDVALRVARALDVALGERERGMLAERPTSDAQAYDYYMRGQDFLRQAEGITQPRFLVLAEEMFGRAIARDQGFGAAYGQRARALFNLASASPSDAERRRALGEAMAEARRVAPDAPEVRSINAWYLMFYENDPDRGYEEMVRAQAARPNDASLLSQLGTQQILRGRWEEGLANLDAAVVLDPRSTVALTHAASSAINYRRFDDVDRYSDRIIELSPDSWTGYSLKAQSAILARGDTAAARRIITGAESRLPPPPGAVVQMYPLFGPEYKARYERATLASIGAQQAFDSVNFHLGRGLYFTRVGRPEARGQLDSALIILDRIQGPRVNAASVHGAYAMLYAALGRESDARASLALATRATEDAATNPQSVSAINSIAIAHTLLGDHDAAVAALRRALELPAGVTVPYLRMSPVFEPLRSHPGFRAL